jgi:hypothetical protein
LRSWNEKSAAKRRQRCAAAVTSLALLSPFLMAGWPVVAGAADAGNPAPQAHQVKTRSSIDERVRQFGKNYELNEAQQAAVKKILEQRQEETLRIRLDPSLTGSARIERFRALQDATIARIRAVLNEEQRKKYNPLAPRAVPQAKDQRSVEDWLKLTTPQ